MFPSAYVQNEMEDVLPLFYIEGISLNIVSQTG